ncbi:hypothetical protein JCM8547_008850 [Rhodosporidiobolus lusitaniae]
MSGLSANPNNWQLQGTRPEGVPRLEGPTLNAPPRDDGEPGAGPLPGLADLLRGLPPDMGAVVQDPTLEEARRDFGDHQVLGGYWWDMLYTDLPVDTYNRFFRQQVDAYLLTPNLLRITGGSNTLADPLIIAVPALLIPTSRIFQGSPPRFSGFAIPTDFYPNPVLPVPAPSVLPLGSSRGAFKTNGVAAFEAGRFSTKGLQKFEIRGEGINGMWTPLPLTVAQNPQTGRIHPSDHASWRLTTLIHHEGSDKYAPLHAEVKFFLPLSRVQQLMTAVNLMPHGVHDPQARQGPLDHPVINPHPGQHHQNHQQGGAGPA